MNPALSFWERDTWLQPFDFLIIGGGIVGINTAIHLKRAAPAARIGVLDRMPLGAGASTRNAGFACFGSLSELLDDRAQTGAQHMLELVAKRWQGLQLLRQMLGDDQIGLNQKGGYELFLEKDAALYEACLEAMPDINRALLEVTGEREVFQTADAKISAFGFGKHVHHLIKNRAEGQLHPGKMMQAFYQMATELEVFFLRGVEVADIDYTGPQVHIWTNEGWELQAGRVLLATNGFSEKILPELELRPARNQVLISKPVSKLPFSGTFHYNRGYVYFRDVGDRILLGGGRDLAEDEETTAEFGTTSFIQAYLQRLLSEVILPDREVEIDAWWSGILGVGPQKAPIIRSVNERLGVAVRLGGMGVAIGSLVGKEAADMLLGEER